MSNWKDTLLMPKTKFAMRINFETTEAYYREQWASSNLCAMILNKNQAGPKFILHDGPPYANGDIHVGHALNKILKDIIVRHRSLNGYFAPFLLGWDTHGLPIENAVTKLGLVKKNDDPALFRNECRRYAQQQIENQKAQFGRLGLLTVLESYVTYETNYEAYQIDFLIMMIEQQLIYRGFKPVYWSPSSQTALAEAEVEYLEKKSLSIFVALKIKNNKQLVPEDTSLLIWTTTPWTLTSNQFVAVNQELVYVVISCQLGKLVVAKALLEQVTQQCQLSEVTIIQELLGRDLIGMTYYHPIYATIINRVVEGHHVMATEGTALVHTACAFGVDDFIIGQENNTAPIISVDARGKFNNVLNDREITGKFYEDVNDIIVSRLQSSQQLVAAKVIKHSYPHDWRTKKPLIYRATEQWFISIKDLKDDLLAEINKVGFLPSWGQERMWQMIANRDDWCISRQRLWGVPITILYGEDDLPIYDVALIKHFRNLIAKHGTDIWWKWSVAELLPENYQHPQAPQGKFRKEMDIMDVWFDSGISHWNLWQEHQWKYPVDLYLEGNDQFRGWFNSSLITGVISPQRKAPYKQVIIHGFINDEKGRKMSKSLGNVIKPLDISNTYGTDVFRLWVAAVDYTDEVKIGNEILKQVAENYRKIRNTMRFMLGNLFDFKLSDVVMDFEVLDQYLLLKTKEYHQATQLAYERYDFNEVYVLTNNFIVNTISAFYLDVTKDILYIEAAESLRRKQVQTTIYYILQTLLFNLAPILVYTCEEVYEHLPIENKELSVFLMKAPQLPEFGDAKTIQKLALKLHQVREDVNKALEVARQEKVIGKSLQAAVVIQLEPEYAAITKINNLAQIFIVSEFQVVSTLTTGTKYPTGKILVNLKQGTKCARCWLIVDNVVNELCARCQKIIIDLEETN